MALKELLTLGSLEKPLTREEGSKILERDRYQCQYCGLDGLAQFENSLVMSVDFIVPRAHKGKKVASNLTTACRPCNLVKGRRVFKTFEEAKAYVLQRRAELRKEWVENAARLRTKSPSVLPAPSR
jgi:5-methylcytosine-specific restriction endonuclease McrA